MGKEIARTTFVQEINSSKLFSTRNQVSFRSKIFVMKEMFIYHYEKCIYVHISIQIPKYHEIHIINIQKGRQWKVSCAGDRIGYHFA